MKDWVLTDFATELTNIPDIVVSDILKDLQKTL